MADHDTIVLQLKQIISEEADDFGVENITPATRLRADLNLSGIQCVSMAYMVETIFGIQFDERGFDAIVIPKATVADVLAAVERQLPRKGTSA